MGRGAEKSSSPRLGAEEELTLRVRAEGGVCGGELQDIGRGPEKAKKLILLWSEQMWSG